MRKIFTGLILTALVFCFGGTIVSAAAPAAVTVTVTIADKDGKLALARESVSVTDRDGNGIFTIDEALFAAHERAYPGGAAAGYASSAGAYGQQLDRLWGVANGGSYGYDLNNTAASSLDDPVQDGDALDAFVYTDLVGFSDTYCYFDRSAVAVRQGETVTLTLTAAGYDAAYNPITLPVKNAVITINGAATACKTDENGCVIFPVTSVGTNVISATSATQVLVPPVCIVTVAAVNTPAQVSPVAPAAPTTPSAPTSPKTGDTTVLFSLYLLLTAGLVSVLLCRTAGKHNKNER